MTRRLLILATLLLPLAAQAQFDAASPDARAGALGGCYVRPADSTGYVDVGWRQAFGVKGMATRTLGLGTPLGAVGQAALRYCGFGDADYNVHRLTAGCSMTVASWLTIMVYGLYTHSGTLDAHYVSQEWLDAGGGVAAGGDRLWAYALAGSRSWSDTRPWRLRAGVNYCPMQQLTTAVAVSYDERVRLRCGVEYAIERHAFLRAGLCSNPLALTFGIGYSQRHYHIDLATEVHSLLGLSPQISLGLCL